MGRVPRVGFLYQAFAKLKFYWLKFKIEIVIFFIDKAISLSISFSVNPTPGWVNMGWVGLGSRIFDPPNVGLGTYFRQPNQPNNPLGQGNPSGRPYRTGTLYMRVKHGTDTDNRMHTSSIR